MTNPMRDRVCLIPLKLPQKSHVVLDEQADVADAVLAHRDPLDAEAEGPAAKLLGVDADGFEDIGMNHAAAGGLLSNPKLL